MYIRGDVNLNHGPCLTQQARVILRHLKLSGVGPRGCASEHASDTWHLDNMTCDVYTCHCSEALPALCIILSKISRASTLAYQVCLSA